MQLADKAKASQKAKKTAKGIATPSPITSSGIRFSPYGERPSAALSPAGRSLASKLGSKRGSVGHDIQLRASYTASATRKDAARVGGVTPSPLPTPSPAPLDAKGTPSHASSITDNLLDIPSSSGKSKKGKSITDDLLI